MINIRPAVASDAAGMTELVHNSKAYAGIYQPIILTQFVDADYIRKHTARVAENGDQLAGFYTLVVPGRGSTGEGELDFMFVADHLQGQGVGRLLIDDLTRCASKLGLVRINIVSHPPAEAFYRAIGAHRIGTIPPRGPVTWARPLLALELQPT